MNAARTVANRRSVNRISILTNYVGERTGSKIAVDKWTVILETSFFLRTCEITRGHLLCNQKKKFKMKDYYCLEIFLKYLDDSKQKNYNSWIVEVFYCLLLSKYFSKMY